MVVRDGLRLMLQFYDNYGQLSLVEESTGVPKENLKRFCDGDDDCFTQEQDKVLRKMLRKYGSMYITVS